MSLIGINLDREREEGRCGADCGNDERLADEIGAGCELSGLSRSNKMSDDEAVNQARKRQQRERQGERDFGFGEAEQLLAVVTHLGSSRRDAS